MSAEQPLPVPAPSPLDGELPPEVVALAREWVEVERSKVAVEAKAIDANEQQDKRLAEFHTRRIELDAEADVRRHKLSTGIVRTVGFILVAPACLLFYMAFWGADAQREVAMTILTTSGIGIAGWGIISAAIRGVQAIRAS